MRRCVRHRRLISQVVAQVIGLDHTDGTATMPGEFELAMGIPPMGRDVATQTRLLAETFREGVSTTS